MDPDKSLSNIVAQLHSVAAACFVRRLRSGQKQELRRARGLSHSPKFISFLPVKEQKNSSFLSASLHWWDWLSSLRVYSKGESREIVAR